MRIRIATLASACLIALSGAASADVIDGKVTRDGIDLFYGIVGPATGDYVLVLSGGPGEDIHSMQGIADELGKKYRCVMWEQRGTGRSKADNIVAHFQNRRLELKSLCIVLMAVECQAPDEQSV